MHLFRYGLILAALAALSVAAPARAAEMGFEARAARLDCAGEAPVAIVRGGNALVLPDRPAGGWASCTLAIDFAARDARAAPILARHGLVEIMIMGVQRSAFPRRHALGAEGTRAERVGDIVRVSVPVRRLLGPDGRPSAALAVGLPSDDGRLGLWSDTLLIESADRRKRRPRPTPL